MEHREYILKGWAPSPKRSERLEDVVFNPPLTAREAEYLLLTDLDMHGKASLLQRWHLAVIEPWVSSRVKSHAYALRKELRRRVERGWARDAGERQPRKASRWSRRCQEDKEPPEGAGLAIRANWWIRRKLRIVLALVAIGGTISFTSFIYYECLKQAAWAVHIAFTSGAPEASATALSRLVRVQQRAARWEHWAGWVNFVMHHGYVEYFCQVTPAAITSFYELGVEKGFWENNTFTDPAEIRELVKQVKARAVQVTWTPESVKWSGPIQVTNSVERTPRWAYVGKADGAFWQAWRVGRENLKQDGFSCRPTTNDWWEVLRYCTKEEVQKIQRQALVQSIGIR